jgi:hypothetical protein
MGYTAGARSAGRHGAKFLVRAVSRSRHANSQCRQRRVLLNLFAAGLRRCCCAIKSKGDAIAPASERRRGLAMAQGERALIVGARAGLGAALARRCAGEGMAVVLAARDTRQHRSAGLGNRTATWGGDVLSGASQAPSRAYFGPASFISRFGLLRSMASARRSNSSAHTRSCSLAAVLRARIISSRQRRANTRKNSAFMDCNGSAFSSGIPPGGGT